MKLIHLIPTLEIGGAETALVRLIENTSWDQEVICLYEKGPLSTKLEARSIKVTSLSMKKTLFSKVVGFIKLLKILYVKKPSHFQTWLYEADFFGFVAAVILKPVLKVKIYFTIRCSDMKLSRLKSQFLKVLAFFSRFVTKCIVNSYAGYAFHEKQGYKNLFLIPNAVDTDYFKPNLYLKESFKKEHSISDQTFVIGMVARLDNIKNHPLLLKAFNILCAKGYDVHLVLAGKGVEVLSGPYRTCFGAVCETSSLYPVFDVSILPS
ncbi:MAG TPA: glycosyltransferase, partial [Alphaproteobacteria bacterium]|nr:glycosyltransferase [Alphaproteobacteria bacterium]